MARLLFWNRGELLSLDEGLYAGRGGAFLFATVLRHFLGLYASDNSFTQLVAKRLNREEEWDPLAAVGRSAASALA